MTRYTGIDAHKADLHVTVLEEHEEEADYFHVPNTPIGFEELIDRLLTDDQVGIEACDRGYPMVKHLIREEITV